MQIITGITADPKQSISIPLPDGTAFTLNLGFYPQQSGWFYDVIYSTKTISFECDGSRLVTAPNILRQYQNIIPFGIGVVTAGSIEPTTQTAFSDGTITLLLLDLTDIAQIEYQIYTGSNSTDASGFMVLPAIEHYSTTAFSDESGDFNIITNASVTLMPILNGFGFFNKIVLVYNPVTQSVKYINILACLGTPSGAPSGYESFSMTAIIAGILATFYALRST